MFLLPQPLPQPPPLLSPDKHSSIMQIAESSAHMNLASMDSLDAPMCLVHPSLSRSVFHTADKVVQFCIHNTMSSGAHTLIRSKILASFFSNQFPKLST